MRELCTLNAPVTSDLDIYRSAKLLIDRHGEHTPIQAAMRADAMLGNGDMDGKRVWVRIMKAIEELQRQEPAPGERAWGGCTAQERRLSPRLSPQTAQALGQLPR